MQKLEVYTKTSEGLDPQDGTESSPVDLDTERSGFEDSLQQKLTGLLKLEAYTKASEGLDPQGGTESKIERSSGGYSLPQECLSQRPKSQPQERDLTFKKPSELRKRIEARGQEPDYAIYSRAEAIKTDDRTRTKSTLLYIDGKTLQNILNLELGRCAGKTKANLPCNNQIAMSRWKGNFPEPEKKLNVRDFLDCEGEIHHIATELLCIRWHKGQASNVVQEWRTKIEKWIRRADRSGPIQVGMSFNSREMSQGKYTLRTSSGPTTRSQTKGQTEEISQDKDNLYTSSGPTTRSKSKGQTKEIPASEAFTRIFIACSQTQQNLAERILKLMRKGLSTQDKLDGLIYIYWLPGNLLIPKGLVKIGVTTVTTESRLIEWKKCHPDLVCKYPLDSIKFPHAHRVENLCHAELKNFQHRQTNYQCTRSHKELYAVPLTKAIEVVQRWTAWACGQPYHTNGLIREECISGIGSRFYN